MNEALAKWTGELQQHPLPALKANLELLSQLSANERNDMGLLADIIESDPGLSVMLLRHVNTIRQKNHRDEITSPRHALMMLGLQQLRLLLPGLSNADELPAKVQQRLRHLYCRAFHAAWQSKAWGEQQRAFEVEELFTAALLGNLGEIMLSLHAADELEKVNALIDEQQLPTEQAQQQIFGFSFAQLTLELARAWKLPLNLYNTGHTEITILKRVLIVHQALQLAQYAEQGWYQPMMYQLLDEISEFSGLDSASVASRTHLNAIEAAHQSLVYQVAHPAAQLLYPAESPDKIEPEKANKKSPFPEWPRVAKEAFCLAPQRLVLLQTMRQLKEAPEKLPAATVVKLVTQAMHHGLGLNRVVFATIQQGQLGPVQLLNNDSQPAFSQFSIELNGHNLFARLLEKPQALWMDDDNRKKFFPLIPINFHKLIDNDSFFVMSLFVGNKPLGLFYADRASRNCRLNEESYKRFKQLVTMASHHLEKG